VAKACPTLEINALMFLLSPPLTAGGAVVFSRGMKIALDIEEADIERIVRSLDNQHAYTSSRNLEDSGSGEWRYHAYGDSVMRYAAVLDGQSDLLEKVAPCFASQTVRIKKFRDEWILDSSTFDSCGEPTEVFPLADATLELVNRIVALYSGLCSPFTVKFIWEFNAEGVPCRRCIRGIRTITIYSPDGFAELAKQSGGQPLGSAIAQKAGSDPAVGEALQLRGNQELGWSRIYDIIEFLGGADEIQRAGWAHKKRTGQVRQTANHFRYLGSRKKYPLPTTPITIDEGRIFVSHLLMRWLASQL
jgi:hypothetical protein